MFYKNKEQSLDMDIFENPPSKYRGAPFWSWNAHLDEERLEEQIQRFKEMGFGGFYMHPRGGMETEYLSEEYLNCITHCIKSAKEKGIYACLYDEDRWPSGFAGGLVTENPKYRQRAIYITANKSAIPKLESCKEAAVKKGSAYLIGCYDIEFSKQGYLKSYKMISPKDKEKHRKYYAYSKTETPSGRYNFQTFSDIMQEEATEKFINLTHKTFFERFGEDYGATVPTIFSDEPRHIPLSQMSEAPQAQGVCYWTYNLDKKFKVEYGYDIVERLPKLFWDIEGVYSSERYDFFNFTTKLTQKAFFEQVHKTTKQQGLMYCGHLMLEDDLYGQLQWGGDAMRIYPHFDIPGIDMLYDNIEFVGAKQVQSVVRQYGKDAMLSELYGVTGWDFDFKCLKMQGDWQAVLGVSVRVPHLSMYSMKGRAKRDYPASFNYQAPWYKEFKCLEDHYARINAVFSGCHDIVDVAVIHPIETVMLINSTKEKSFDSIKLLENTLQKLTASLLYNNIDFDFISEGNLPFQKTDYSEKLAVGEMKYSVVIIPPVKTLRKTTLTILEKFIASGGKVIFTAECPQYVDGRKSDKIKAVYAKSLIINSQDELLLFLDNLRRVRITSENTENKKICRLGKIGENYWLFTASAQKMGKTSPERRSTLSEKTVIEVKGEFGVTIYNTLTGKTENADYFIKEGNTFVFRDWYVNDSLLIKLTKEPTDKKETSRTPPPYNSITIKNASYKRHEQNVIVLDMCEVSYDGISYNQKNYVFLQNDIICDELGIVPTEAQPYVVKNPPEFNIFARFSFECEAELDELCFAIERASNAEIYFNGKKIENNPKSYYVDRDIKSIPLCKAAVGKNIIEVKIPVSQVHQLEPCYVLGEFDAHIDKNQIILSPIKSDKINFKPIGHQGLPFYSGNISYTSLFSCDDCIAEIIVENFAAPCIRVFIDNNDVGLIAFSPFSIKAPLFSGEHKIEFVCYGNRNNTFGPIHNSRITDPFYYITPLSWDFKDKNFSKEYHFQETGILDNPIIRFYKKEHI